MNNNAVRVVIAERDQFVYWLESVNHQIGVYKEATSQFVEKLKELEDIRIGSNVITNRQAKSAEVQVSRQHLSSLNRVSVPGLFVDKDLFHAQQYLQGRVDSLNWVVKVMEKG